MAKILESPDDACYQFALELETQIKTYFAFVLDPKHKDYCVEYLVATYLTPNWRYLIKPELKTAIRKYLEGNFYKFIVCKIPRLLFQSISRFQKMPVLAPCPPM